MHKIILGILPSILFSSCLFAQAATHRLPFEDSTLHHQANYTVMPYNRLIQSAGKVITYGDPNLENHTLDLCALPEKQHVVIEDRYGIAVMDLRSHTIVARFSFTAEKEWQPFVSTYSGITAYTLNGKTMISWGAASPDTHASVIMLAEWDGKNLQNISGITIPAIAPAAMALPNQIVTNEEQGNLYFYVVLNGNNQLLKINATTRQIVWAANTGVAPYGVCIINNKAYVTNWAGPLVTDTTRETASTPWGSAYTNPVTGATANGSLSVLNLQDGSLQNEILLGLHPNAIIKSPDSQWLYVANANSDAISVVNVATEKVVNTIATGLFKQYFGSSPIALCTDASGKTLYVANAMDNAIAVIHLNANEGKFVKANIVGYIPTEAYPSGILLMNHQLYVTNLEAKGANVLSPAKSLKQSDGFVPQAFTIHKQLASFSIIPLPNTVQLNTYTQKVKQLNLINRTMQAYGTPRKNRTPAPVPERMGEPSVFKHVVYIIKENKTYDQVMGDVAKGRGDEQLCIYGKEITPNQHQLANDFCLLDNYYASGKSSAEGHQWTDAGMVSDYVERNVRAWFRSYPHRQDDALVYNKNGFIWNVALDHGKKVRVYGEACLSHYNTQLNWFDIYEQYKKEGKFTVINTTTIGRLRPIIAPDYPDCDNISLTDQIRADVFIKEWKAFEAELGDQLPDLTVLSLPNNHTAGLHSNYPTPRAMVADNDWALGRIIETITHSRFWDSTVVFVTEDDSQSGWDHISSYRTVCQVISPYSVTGKTIHTQYNQTAMLRTIEQILGLPPMNVIDATALPMFDCFTPVKKAYQYTVIPNKIPLDERNKPVAQLKGPAKHYAQLSEKVFYDVDGGDDALMNKILWFDAKGLAPYPASNTPKLQQ
ncbi:MAG: phosphoesterase [Sphingobacteriales bacterium]|uniref:alkaline phosphatase family protein n=1 Tax=Hydrotalea flava TaxID=714549 RepID=UPI000833F66E|nr:alkaline phosphatase family protein [Hydrotalea flava]RTL47638.1 MAG: phosphoesterase [Sphingobacteriales bacterium]